MNYRAARTSFRENNITTADYICLYIHYNEFGHLNDSLIKISQLLEHRNVTSIITSSYLNERSKRVAMAHFDFLITRTNTGRDFGAIIDAADFLLQFQALQFKKLLVLNNSMLQVLPIENFARHLEYLLDEATDLAGITSSYGSGYYHVQTYHFSISRAFYESSSFSEFIDTYDVHSIDREYAVREGEVRLSQIALNNEFTCGAFYDWPRLYTPSLISNLSSIMEELITCGVPSQLVQKIHLESLAVRGTNNLKYNPTHLNWLLMLLDGYPFIKRELLETNPLNLDYHYVLPAILQRLSIDKPVAHDLDSLNLLLRPAKDWLYDTARVQSNGPPPII